MYSISARTCTATHIAIRRTLSISIKKVFWIILMEYLIGGSGVLLESFPEHVMRSDIHFPFEIATEKSRYYAVRLSKYEPSALFSLS